MFVRTMLV